MHFTVEHANTKRGNTETHTHRHNFFHPQKYKLSTHKKYTCKKESQMRWTHSEREADDFCGCTLLDSLGSLTMRDPRNVPWEVMWCRASRTFSRENTVRMDVSRVWGFSLNSRGLRNLMLKCSNLKKWCTAARVRDLCMKGGERTWWLWLTTDIYICVQWFHSAHIKHHTPSDPQGKSFWKSLNALWNLSVSIFSFIAPPVWTSRLSSL